MTKERYMALADFQTLWSNILKPAIVSNVTFSSGVLQKTINGKTSTVVTLDTAPTSGSSNPVTSGGVHSAVEDARLIPVDIDSLTPTSTFVKNNILGLNGAFYHATQNTSNFPVILAVQDGEFVVNTINGKKVFVVADNTLQSGWEQWSDAQVEYWIDQIESQLDGKQPTISDLSTIRSGAAAGATAYQKPSTGIPATDLSSAVQSTLGDVSDIEALIPTQATSSNQLADKDFVNSSISTSTAEFRGTFTSQSAMEAVTADENDYAFLVTTDSDGNTIYNRYKYSGSAWAFEYALNNSSFTAAQWTAIQSGITSALVSKLSALPTNSELNTSLAGKQDTISDLSTIRSGAAAGATALQSHQSVTNNNPTLAWGETKNVGSVGETNLQVTMPSNPDTHYTATVIVGANSSSVTPPTMDSYPAYINIVENGVSTGGIKVRGEDGIQVYGNDNVITVECTYTNKNAEQNGSAKSLVTTGEKYTWNNKISLDSGFTYNGTRYKISDLLTAVAQLMESTVVTQ